MCIIYFTSVIFISKKNVVLKAKYFKYVNSISENHIIKISVNLHIENLLGSQNRIIYQFL
jgi:hypothetical protein